MREDSIAWLVQAAKDILNRMPEFSYFRTAAMSQEEREQKKTVWLWNWKEFVIEDLTTHLKKILQEPKKEGTWRKESDKKLEKLFDGIHSITESHEFENFCEQLWDLDEGKYREILWAEGKAILKQTFLYMNEEERKSIKYYHDTWWLFKEIEQEVIRQEKEEQEKQLLLFDLPPTHSLEWYIKQVISNIETLIGKVSYMQERLFEKTIWKIFNNRWIKENVDSSELLPTLSDEEFLEILKNMEKGKLLSLKLKKTNGKILPNINDWIDEMKKKKEKED